MSDFLLPDTEVNDFLFAHPVQAVDRTKIVTLPDNSFWRNTFGFADRVKL